MKSNGTVAQPSTPRWWLFLQQWMKAPLRTAAIVPSGPELAAAMLAELPAGARRVIELGGGTGALTKALLAHGIAPADLLVLELNDTLHAQLQHRFPQMRVVHGDARRLREIIEQGGHAGGGPVDAVVSGLGLLSMPQHVQRDIFAAAFDVLRPGGAFVQFTYGLGAPLAGEVVDAIGLRVRRGAFVLRNVPPATVYVYTRGATIGQAQPCVPPADLATTALAPTERAGSRGLPP